MFYRIFYSNGIAPPEVEDLDAYDEYDIPEAVEDVDKRAIPHYNEAKGCFEVRTEYGLEQGDIEYIVAEYTHMGCIYRFKSGMEPDERFYDHEHTFARVLEAVLKYRTDFSIEGFEYDYSAQERRVIERFKERLAQE